MGEPTTRHSNDTGVASPTICCSGLTSTFKAKLRKGGGEGGTLEIVRGKKDQLEPPTRTTNPHNPLCVLHRWY